LTSCEMAPKTGNQLLKSLTVGAIKRTPAIHVFDEADSSSFTELWISSILHHCQKKCFWQLPSCCFLLTISDAAIPAHAFFFGLEANM